MEYTAYNASTSSKRIQINKQMTIAINEIIFFYYKF